MITFVYKCCGIFGDATSRVFTRLLHLIQSTLVNTIGKNISLRGTAIICFNMFLVHSAQVSSWSSNITSGTDDCRYTFLFCFVRQWTFVTLDTAKISLCTSVIFYYKYIQVFNKRHLNTFSGTADVWACHRHNTFKGYAGRVKWTLFITVFRHIEKTSIRTVYGRKSGDETQKAN